MGSLESLGQGGAGLAPLGPMGMDMCVVSARTLACKGRTSAGCMPLAQRLAAKIMASDLAAVRARQQRILHSLRRLEGEIHVVWDVIRCLRSQI